MRPRFNSWVGKIPWRRDGLPTPVFLGFPGGSDGKESACNEEHLGSIPWRRAWQPTPVFLPRESHGQRSLAGYSPWGCKESDMTEWPSTHNRRSQRSKAIWTQAFQNGRETVQPTEPLHLRKNEKLWEVILKLHRSSDRARPAWFSSGPAVTMAGARSFIHSVSSLNQSEACAVSVL